MDGASAGASTVESSTAAILMPSAAEHFITTPHSCTEIIEDSLLTEASLPRMAHSERTRMRAHREATRGLPTASPAAIAAPPLTGALEVTEHTQATADIPAADMPALDTAAVEVTAAADTAGKG